MFSGLDLKIKKIKRGTSFLICYQVVFSYIFSFANLGTTATRILPDDKKEKYVLVQV